jgi:MraZ protein
MGLFVSTHWNKLDSKNRVSVPASFRAVLGESGAQKLSLFPSFVCSAMEGGGPELVEALEDAVSEESGFFSEQQSALRGAIFGSLVELAWDGEGRVVLPKSVLDHTGITGEIAFVGMGRSFQLWEAEAFRKSQADARARLMANPPNISLRKRSV